MITLNIHIQNALDYAIRKHDQQYRKGTKIPYSIHPVSLAMLLLELELKTEIIAAALLHDTIEDTDVTYDEIKEVFNQEIADLVLGCTEEIHSQTWDVRKNGTINKFPGLAENQQWIILADKVHNLYSMSVQKESDDVWQHFSRGYEDQKWYYTSLLHVFEQSKIADSKLFDAYQFYYQNLFGGNA